jgi:hypothetical protein
VVVVHWSGNAADDSFTPCRRASDGHHRTRPLITRRGDRVVVLTEARPDDNAVHAALAQ